MAHGIMHSLGYKVIYGDTDSCFIVPIRFLSAELREYLPHPDEVCNIVTCQYGIKHPTKVASPWKGELCTAKAAFTE